MKVILKDKNNEVRVLWVVLISIVNFFVSIVGMNLLFLSLFPNNKILGYGLYCAAACTLSIVVTRFIGNYSFAKDRLQNMDFLFGKGLLSKITSGFIIGLVTNGVWALICWYLGQLEIMYNGFNLEVFVISFFAYLAVAVVEECTFRGLIDTAFSKFGSVVGILSSSTMFAFMHGGFEEGGLAFIERFAFGILFSLLMRRTHSLIFVVSAHFSHNFVYTAIAGIGETGRKTLFSTLFTSKANFLAGSVDDGSLILILVLMALVCITLFQMSKDNGKLNKVSA